MPRISHFVIVAALAATACQNQNRDAERRDEPRTTQTDQDRNRGALDQNRRENDALATMRGDYKNRLNAVLTDLDRYQQNLKDKKSNATGKAKDVLDEQINNLDKRKDILENDMKLVDKATPDTWNTIKDQVDKDIRDVRSLMQPAGKT